MRTKELLCASLTALCALSAQSANIFWNGNGAGDNWLYADNWGGGGALPGENQADYALITFGANEGYPAKITTALDFNNSVRLALRNKSNLQVEDGGSAVFASIQVGVHASAGNGQPH